jgi:hypothetical protein
VTQIVVSGSSFGSFSTLEELGGKEIYVNPLMAAYENLQKANASLQKGRQDSDPNQSSRQEPERG